MEEKERDNTEEFRWENLSPREWEKFMEAKMRQDIVELKTGKMPASMQFIEKLTIEQVLERYDLTEDQIKALKETRKDVKNNVWKQKN